MTAAAAPALDLTLDACAALRADLGAPGPAAPTPPDVALPPGEGASAAPPHSAGTQAAWLTLVLTVERAAELAPRDRAAHFRRARAAWEDAGATLGAPEYAAVGARLARWRAADPTLPLVKRLLWALEQPEAVGYTHLALAGYSALLRLVPAGDVRAGYVLAQSARAVRTLGDLQTAVDRYEFAERLGTTHRDAWLRVRSAIGLSAAYVQIGNYPAAREVFHRVLRKGSPDARFTAVAHHGLLLAAMSAQDWEAALHHGWYLLRAARGGAVPRVDVLLLMASLCCKIGRYRAAVGAAQAALKICSRPDDHLIAHRTLAEVGLATDDPALAARSGDAIRAALNAGSGPFEDARALHTLALLGERWGSAAAAREDAEQAYALAQSGSFHELAFEIEPTRARLRDGSATEAGSLGDRETRVPESVVELSPQAHRIVARIASVAHEDEVLAAT